MTFTFFDLLAAVREIRQVNFHTASADLISIPTTVRNASRSGRIWEITTTDGQSFLWNEDNANAPILSFVDSPIRAVSRFGFFDLMAAMREIRTLRFTTGGVDTLSIPTSLHNRSRNSSSYTVVTTGGSSFTWDDNNAGATVISEV